MACLIGVDFDNTLVDYTAVLQQEAARLGLMVSRGIDGKQGIRDMIRQLPDGEQEWQRVQAVVYGSRMHEATLIEGVRAFFACCKQRQAKVFVISHKTEYAAVNDWTTTNLRVAAIEWMRARGFFEPEGLDLSMQDVYFESTRRQKIERIQQLQCTHFIDDLEETFLEEPFPPDVEKILYAPHGQRSSLPGVRVTRTWQEIIGYVCHAAH